MSLSDRHSWSARFIRFLGVGVLNTACGSAAYARLVLIGLSPQPALAIAFAMGILWNYLAHARLVFDTRGVSRIVPYAAAYGVIYAINALALAAALRTGLNAYVAQALLVLPMAALSFVMISLVLTGHLPFSGIGQRHTSGDANTRGIE